MPSADTRFCTGGVYNDDTLTTYTAESAATAEQYLNPKRVFCAFCEFCGDVLIE